MKKRFTRWIAAGMSGLFVLSGGSLFASAATTPNLDIASDAYVVADAASGQILIEKNMNKQKAPASITKILTLALALENGNLEDSITVSYDAAHSIEPGSTHIALEVGEVVSFRDAVMGTQLISANDAANVVAEYTSGSLDAFVDRMNLKVQELGLTGSHFVNPNGLDARGHYVTAYDMAQITRYALSVPGFREVFGTTEYQMPPSNRKARNYKFYAQSSIMFPENREYYEGITGSKLGYTHNANHTIVALAKRGNMELIVVALDSKGSSPKYDDTKKLLDYCFERYETVTLSARELKTAQVPIASLEQPTGIAQVEAQQDHTFVVPLGTPKSALNIRYDLPDLYKSERKIDPSFSVSLADGTVLYTAPLQYSILPVDPGAAYTQSLLSIPKKDFLNDLMIVALKCLLVVMMVAMAIFFVYRSMVMTRYAFSQRTMNKRRMEALRRREQALLRRSEENRVSELEELLREREHACYGVPDNVTHFYPTRQQPPTTRNPNIASRRRTAKK